MYRLDEERRLFYVALTRAMKRLTMSYVLWRTKYGQRQSQLPSPFFKELDRKYIDELDYAQHMKQPATVEESQNFIAGLKAMLAGD